MAAQPIFTRQLRKPALPAILIAALTVLSSPSLAQQPGGLDARGYIGGAALLWERDPDNSSSLDSRAFQFRFGSRLSPYFSLESRFALGGSDSINGSEFELDLLGSLLIRPQLPVNDHVAIYGLFGFSTLRGSLETEETGLFGGTSSNTVSDTDISYGIGIAFAMVENLYLEADYAVYVDESDYNFSGTSLGISYLY